MTEQHPNLLLLSRLDLRDLDASADLFSTDFVWHYFNPKLPDIQGDYVGVEGLKRFLEALAKESNATFSVERISATPIGDELVVVHVRNTLKFDDDLIRINAVVVWRIVEGKFAEAWDIPAVFTLAD